MTNKELKQIAKAMDTTKDIKKVEINDARVVACADWLQLGTLEFSLKSENIEHERTKTKLKKQLDELGGEVAPLSNEIKALETDIKNNDEVIKQIKYKLALLAHSEYSEQEYNMLVAIDAYKSNNYKRPFLIGKDEKYYEHTYKIVHDIVSTVVLRLEGVDVLDNEEQTPNQEKQWLKMMNKNEFIAIKKALNVFAHKLYNVSYKFNGADVAFVLFACTKTTRDGELKVKSTNDVRKALLQRINKQYFAKQD